MRRPTLAPVDEFLKHVSELIHVGANAGQERDTYAHLGIRVVWVEPIPGVFESLRANIARYPEQTAFRYLLADRDDAIVPFHVASNDGLSSSMLELEHHTEIWPDVSFDRTIYLETCTLDTMLRREQIEARAFDALVLDTQGSELLILEGAEELLRTLQYIKIEVADFEAYRGCCQLNEVERFMGDHGFVEDYRDVMIERAGYGCYYDIVYRRHP